jgi:maltoporin
MVDTNILLIIGIVAVVAVILYAVERYTQKKPVEWTDAYKIGLLSGAGAGGIVYAMGGGDNAVAAVTEMASSASSTVQDMFVGKPSF